MEGFRCIVNCNQEQLDEDCEMAPLPKYWSDPNSWASGAVPVEGDEVSIPPCEWVEYDLEDSPIFKQVTVNGRLSFKDTPDEPANRTVNTFIMYVRAGELWIGTEDSPYQGNATIKLFGDPHSETIAPSFMVEFGNKGLFIVNEAKLYGKPRDRMSRLREIAYKGD